MSSSDIDAAFTRAVALNPENFRPTVVTQGDIEAGKEAFPGILETDSRELSRHVELFLAGLFQFRRQMGELRQQAADASLPRTVLEPVMAREADIMSQLGQLSGNATVHEVRTGLKGIAADLTLVRLDLLEAEPKLPENLAVQTRQIFSHVLEGVIAPLSTMGYVGLREELVHVFSRLMGNWAAISEGIGSIEGLVVGALDTMHHTHNRVERHGDRLQAIETQVARVTGEVARGARKISELAEVVAQTQELVRTAAASSGAEAPAPAPVARPRDYLRLVTEKPSPL